MAQDNLNAIQTLRSVLLRPGMYMRDPDNPDSFINFLLGFDTAMEMQVLQGFEEWLKSNYRECNGPFGWDTFMYQIATDEQRGKDAVELFMSLVRRFLDEKYGA